MSYFMRRVSVVAQGHRLIMTTATLGAPDEFALSLTGRSVASSAEKDNGARLPAKQIAVVSERDADPFKCKVDLLRSIAQHSGGRFLAFADSRRMVEQLSAALSSGHSPDELDFVEGEEDSDSINTVGSGEYYPVLPYRSGYESNDRNMIQKALASGKL